MAGKGSPAALLAAAVLGMFSAEATYQTSAAPLITRLNHGLFRRAIEARFLTTFYGMLGADGVVHLLQRRTQRAAAGVSAGIRRLETGGVVLGLFEHASFEEETLTLQPGDLIVALQRWRHRGDDPAGEEYTDDRLLACARALLRGTGGPA